MSNELIVLTCTLRPKSLVDIRRKDHEVRIKDYEIAIKKWIKFSEMGDFDLLILENSGSAYVLEDLVLSKTNITLIQSEDDLRSSNEGISGGEFYMLKSCLNQEILDKYAFIWKVSGRNFVRNAHDALKRTGCVDVLCDRTFLVRHACDSRMFGMSSTAWIEFLSLDLRFKKKNGGFASSLTFDSMEHLLTFFVANLEFSGGVQRALAASPIFEGFSGSTNKLIVTRRRRILLRLQKPFRPLIHKLLLGVSP